MIPPARNCAALFLLGALLAAPSHAAPGDALEKDLTTTLKVLGLPCGQVVTATREADNEHVATCKDGTRYRIYVNSAGRVVAQKL